MDPSLVGQEILDRAGENEYRMDTWWWERWTNDHMQKKDTGPLVFSYTEIHSKQTKDLQGRQESGNILEEKAGSTHFELDCSNILLHTSPEARETKAQLND